MTTHIIAKCKHCISIVITVYNEPGFVLEQTMASLVSRRI